MMRFLLAPLVLLAAAPPVLALALQNAAPDAGAYCLRTPIGVAEAGEDEEMEELALNFRPGQEPQDSLEKLGDNELPESIPMGMLGVDLSIEQRDEGAFVTFANYMPDNNQIVAIEAAPARVGDDGTLNFTFVDNWNVAGRGTVTPEGEAVVLRIIRTGRGETYAARYAARQYGEFKLNPGTCAPFRQSPST